MPLNKLTDCYGCPLETKGIGFSYPDGLGTSGVALIGEGLGHDEAMDGLPFRPKGQSGSKLEECIHTAGEELGLALTRNHFKIWNLIACQPPGDKLAHTPYEYAAINHCKRYFNEVIPSKVLSDRLSNPGSSEFRDKLTGRPDIKCIVALGNLPLKHLAGVTGVGTDKQSISHLRGYVLNSPYGPVIGGYHPSYIKRGNGVLTPTLVEDIKRAIRVSNGSFTNFPGHSSYRRPSYIETPSIDDAWSYYYRAKEQIRLPVSYDIETEHSHSTDEDEERELVADERDIIQIQFSTDKHSGIAMPFRDGYIDVAKAFMDLNNLKFGFNCWSFDDPRLYDKGINPYKHGCTHDVMVMFAKHQPSLERALQKVASLFGFPFPWKHLFGDKLAFYGCADTASVLWIIEQLIPLMQFRKSSSGSSVFDNYLEQVYGLKPVLLKASDRGIPVNEEKRIELKKVFEERKKGLLDELQEEIPLELKNVEPKRKFKETGNTSYGYLNIPKEIKQAEGEYLAIKAHLEATQGVGRLVSFRTFVAKKYGLYLQQFPDHSKSGEMVLDENGNVKTVWRWCRLQKFEWSDGKFMTGFNPSKEQLVKYMRWKREQLENSSNEDEQELADEYEIPINLKTKKETTGKKELEHILEKTGDSVIDKALRIRSLGANINNFIPNWKPSRDGRVHCEWSFLQPQGQLATKAPNIQNCSKHTETGQEFRGIVEAPVGYTFVEFDKRSFHVASMGYIAKDPTYIRFSQIDPHSIFTSFIHPKFKHRPVDFSWRDSDILEYCKEIKKWCKKEKEEGGTYGVDLRQSVSKPAVLGNQLGLGPRKLWYQNKKFIHGISSCPIHGEGCHLVSTFLQGVLDEQFEKVKATKDYIRDLANNQTFIQNEWGDIQYFYDVYGWRWNKKKQKWDKVQGDDAEKCLAKAVQGTAFGMIKWELLKCETLGYCEEFNFVNTIHDSLMFMPEVGKAEKCIELVGEVMNAPCPRLVNEACPTGLVVNVEWSMGRNWKKFNKESNPEGMKD